MISNGQMGLFNGAEDQPSVTAVDKASPRSTAGMDDNAAVRVAPNAPSQQFKRREAITDAGLKHFQDAYPGKTITKEDLFYYIYGILHSPDYRQRYADNLSKELPRIPRVKTFEDFQAFTQAGRKLGALHVGYEQVDMYPLKIESKSTLTDADYRVEKMRFAKKKDPATGRSVDDRSTVIYNRRSRSRASRQKHGIML